MDRLKDHALFALALIVSLAALGLFASVGLVVLGLLTVVGLVGAAAAWVVSRFEPQPGADSSTATA